MSEELSLADELRSHLQADEPEVIDTAAEVAAPETETAETSGRARDETGKFAKAEPKAEEAKTEEAAASPVNPEAQQAATETQPQEAMVTRPPATWSATAKAEFAKLPDVVRSEIAKREADFSRGIQQYAEKAKVADRYLNEFQPFDHMFKQLGATHEQFLRDSLSTEYKLRTMSPQDKTQLLMQYAKHYGADLSILPQMLGLQSQAADGQPDIQELVRQSVQQIVSPLQHKVQTWEQQSAKASQRQQQELEQEIQGQLDAFQNEVDESGQPKHIFYENVRGTMSALIANGEAKSLEQAYEMACYANNEVRAALIAKQQSEAEAKRLDEAKRKAADAKRSSFDVSGQGGVGIADTSKLSIADELRAHLRGNARV